MVLLVYTTEGSGMDRYSQELARVLAVPQLGTRRYRLGLQALRLVRRLRREGGLIHYTNQHFGRFALLAGRPFVMTVHDLERLCFPMAPEAPLERLGLLADRLAIRRACHLIAVSHHTRRDLIRWLGVPEERITVIPNGVNLRVFRPDPRPLFPFPYLLYVGSERPRKNLPRLLEAFALLKRRPAFQNLKLVKVGGPGRSPAFRRATLEAVRRLGLEGEVLFVGQRPDADLPAFYTGARALVYPSLYEGFGLPLLEAMACGCPVVASRTSALPEVVGGAGLLVDPLDPGDLAQALEHLLTEEGLRERLRWAGLERVRAFSWEATARETARVYRQTLEALGLAQVDLPEPVLQGDGSPFLPLCGPGACGPAH